MKPKSFALRSRCTLVSLALFYLVAVARGEVIIDGMRGEEEGYGAPLVQETATNWGEGNALANLSVAASGGGLHVFIGGSVQNNAIILFIDSKPGTGQSFIPNNLIQQGGEEYTINNLGSSGNAGLTFEAGFGAEYAVRIFGNGADAYVNTYTLGSPGVPTRTYAGEAGGNNLSSGFITDMFVNWQPVPSSEYATHASGIEMALSLPLLGVPTGAQSVKLLAILVNGGSDYGSNQVLGSRTSATTDLAGEIRTFSFEAEPGIQRLEIAVDNSDSDGDGIPDAVDPDDDNDGLDDTVESGTGVYVGAGDTGSNPLNKDTDGDGHLDGAEVGGTALGYVSNPNVPNFTVMTVPGTFNTPTAWTPTSNANEPSTDMVQGDTASLTGQYRWTLDYRFAAAGPIQYKFAAGSWATNWGPGATAGAAVPGVGANFAVTLPASGLHRFVFDQAALTQSLSRLTFPDVGAYLAAYGLTAGGDDDGDTLANEAEFAANTDPRNPDTDGDGLGDAVETGTGTFVGPGNTGTNSLDPDTDDDGLSDGAETNTGSYVDAANTGTNPHLPDTDGDGESDQIEVFHGTDPTKAGSSLAALGLPRIDGMRDDVYGPPLALQTVETSFGDNTNEWNAAYARVAGGRLAILLTGNLGDNFNKLELFLDTTDGGSSVFSSAGNDGSAAMNGLVFDDGFAPEYHLIIRRGTDGGVGKFDVDFADLVAVSASFHASVFGAANAGWGATGTGVNTLPILVAYNGSNTAGIGGNAGNPADQGAAAAVTTGLELNLDLADLGNPTGPIRVMAVQANDNHSVFSNQSLAGLPPPQGNLGNPATVDFNTIEGDQFFTITAEPASGDFAITRVVYVAATDQLELTVTGLVEGARYALVQSSSLRAPFSEVANSAFTATGPRRDIAVAATVDPRNFFKVVRVP